MRFITNNLRHALAPALLIGALALVFMGPAFVGTRAGAQSQTQDDAPPPFPKPSPSPTPTPNEIIDNLDVVRVDSNLVVVPVSVLDQMNEPVMGLTVPDFRLEEEGRVQEIAQIGSPEDVPLEIAILFDVSSSVSKKFEFEQQAATRFLKQVLKSSDKAAVFAIDKEPRLVQPLTTSEGASATLMGLRAATIATPTAFYDTVTAAARYLAQNTPDRHRRVIVVISDGEDNYSDTIRSTEIALYNTTNAENQAPAQRRAALESRRLQLHQKAQAEVLKEVQRADVVFYSINPSGESLKLNMISQRAEDGMRMVADATGGTSFAPNLLQDLDAVFRRIAAELRAQYLLQYYSTDESPNGKFLRIKVSVPARPQARARARQGYYVKRK